MDVFFFPFLTSEIDCYNQPYKRMDHLIYSLIHKDIEIK